MKKKLGFVLGIILAVSLSVTAAAAYAQETKPDFAKNLTENKIGMEKAVEIALGDAGLNAGDVEFSKKIHEFSDGISKYEIDFMVRNDTKFDYEIDALTGKVLQKEHGFWEPDDDTDYAGLAQAGQDFFTSEDEKIMKPLDEALKAAVADAKVQEDQIVICKFGVCYENGKVVLDAGFLVPGQMKYDYDVEPETNMIVERDIEPWEADDDMKYKDLLAGPEAAAAPEAAAPQGGIAEDQAKQIALDDAGLAESDVRMTKCQRDIDDGIEVYEVSFVGPDGKEYDYEIRVSDGTITDKKAEFDD